MGGERGTSDAEVGRSLGSPESSSSDSDPSVSEAGAPGAPVGAAGGGRAAY
jgi:hypothetical protein